MSAILAVEYNGKVQLLADAFRSSNSSPAVLAKARSKIWTCKRSKIAIGGRGDVAAFSVFARGIALNGFMFGSFDRTFARIEADLANAKRNKRNLRFAEVFVAGISETRGPMIRCFGTAAIGPAEPFKLYAPRTMSFGGHPYFYGGPPVQNIAFRLGDGLETTGAAIMEDARATAAPPAGDPSGEPYFAVGGFAELVTIDHDGVTRQRIREWPQDRIGEKIAPT